MSRFCTLRHYSTARSVSAPAVAAPARAGRSRLREEGDACLRQGAALAPNSAGLTGAGWTEAPRVAEQRDYLPPFPTSEAWGLPGDGHRTMSASLPRSSEPITLATLVMAGLT